MRVALVVPTFPQPSETFIVNKALGLAGRGIDVHVVCNASPQANWEHFGSDHRLQQFRPKVHVGFNPELRPAIVSSVIRQAARLGRAPRGAIRRQLIGRVSNLRGGLRDLLVDAALVELAPDVVHFEFGSLARGRMNLRDRLGAAVTVSFRGYDLNYVGLGEPDFYSEIWAGADRVHVLGDDLWQRALRRGAPSELPHAIITPAIDASSIVPVRPRPGPLGGSEEPLRVLSVGRLHWKKGYDYALEATARLRSRGTNVEYRIVGDGELLGAVAFWRHQLGLDEHVELLRSVPPAEVARQMGWADVMLHAATSEGFCNAVIEAQAHGVPVVCSDADGLGENVEHEVTGLVVPRRDPDALAEGLARLAADGALRERMGAAGRERVERLFRLEDQIDAWVRFYEDAVERRRVTSGKG